LCANSRAVRARVLKALVFLQGMPQKTPAQKPKRAAARGVSKDSKLKSLRPEMLRNHADVRAAMLVDRAADRPGPGVCLVLSPRALVRDLQRTFELEFPLLAGRARFLLDAA